MTVQPVWVTYTRVLGQTTWTNQRRSRPALVPSRRTCWCGRPTRPRYGAAADTLSAVAQTHLRIVGLCVTCSLRDPGPRDCHDHPPPRACARRCPWPCEDLVATWPCCETLCAHLRTHGCLVVPCPVLCRVVHAPPRPLTARQAYIKVPQLHLAGTTPTL